MDMLAYACLAFTAIALTGQIGTCALALMRCRPRKKHVKPVSRPPITIVRPLCGLEHFSRETLRSSFEIDYPDYEVNFCVADEGDAIVPLSLR